MDVHRSLAYSASVRSTSSKLQKLYKRDNMIIVMIWYVGGDVLLLVYTRVDAGGQG